jgi:hypothetical protein
MKTVKAQAFVSIHPNLIAIGAVDKVEIVEVISVSVDDGTKELL